jgi:hypothetical protein
MENNSIGDNAVTEGVSTDSSEQDSSPESNVTPTDVLKNVKSEFNRKISKIDEKINQLINAVANSPRKSSVAETETESPDYKRYIDARFQEVEKDRVKKGQEQAWSKALELFPELNQESEHYDESFYKLADSFYGSFDLSKDPEAPLKAVKLAALESGKVEKLAKEKLLRDEARRSRMIAEGGSIPKDMKREKAPNLNEQNLARLGIKGKTLERLKNEIKNSGEQ